MGCFVTAVLCADVETQSMLIEESYYPMSSYATLRRMPSLDVGYYVIPSDPTQMAIPQCQGYCNWPNTDICCKTCITGNIIKCIALTYHFNANSQMFYDFKLSVRS